MSKLERRTMYFFFAVFAFFVGMAIARAEVYVAGDVSWITYDGPKVDGTWEQQALPSRHGIPAVAQTKEGFGWDAGLGYRFAGKSWYSHLVSIETGYLNFGAGVSAGGLAVSDAIYQQILEGHAPHYKSTPYETTTHMHGGYLRLAKGFEIGYGFELYLSVGFMGASQRTDFHTDLGHGRTQTGEFTGMVAGPMVGGGVKYDVWHGIKARVGAESTWTMTESQHPISSQWIRVNAGIEVPLSLGGL